MNNTFLENWTTTQEKNIVKTHAILDRAFTICEVDAEQIDSLSLELLVSNALMHIDTIVQYEKCIKTLIQSEHCISDTVMKLHRHNNKELAHIEKKFNLLQTSAKEKMSLLQNRVAYTSNVIEQLLH